MRITISQRVRITTTTALALALIGCHGATQSNEPVEWRISWAAPAAHVDKTPLTAQLSYELEMAHDGDKGPWKLVWAGKTSNAVIKESAGYRCFRAMTVEHGIRSKPSPVQCATKKLRP